MTWVMLNQDLKRPLEKSRRIDVTPAFVREDYDFYCKSHKTLLMLRRVPKNENNYAKLELRH